MKPVFAAAGTIDNLRFVRIISVAGIVVLALILFWALVRSGVGRMPAALIALLVCTMPPFQLYASWTVSFSVPWAAVLAGCASLLASRLWMRRVALSTGSSGQRRSCWSSLA